MRKIILAIVGLVVVTASLLYFRWQERQNYARTERMGHGLGINCLNNLMQISLTFRIWNGDHGNQFPFNTSTNAGGTLELCAPDKDGFDSNAFLFIQAMSNELSTVNILICPKDPSKKPAANWASVTASNIT